MYSFSTPWNIRKPSFFGVFRGLKWEQSPEIDYWDWVEVFKGRDLFRIPLLDNIVAFSRRKTQFIVNNNSSLTLSIEFLWCFLVWTLKEFLLVSGQVCFTICHGFICDSYSGVIQSVTSLRKHEVFAVTLKFLVNFSVLRLDCADQYKYFLSPVWKFLAFEI